MSANKRGLGRGLEALLVNVGDPAKQASEPTPKQAIEPPPPLAIEPLPKTLASNPTLVQEAEALKELLLELEIMVSQL